jgi:NAD-dependent deacetylase
MLDEARLIEATDLAARLVLESAYVTAMSGAGLSVESGIPPFRGPGGLWTKYGEPDSRGYDRFLDDPKAWWEARVKGVDTMPEMRALDSAAPNPGHLALAELEEMGILRYIITQNVDNLHLAAGSRNVAEIHGNRFKVRCLECSARFPREAIDYDVLPPRCFECGGILKNDGVMFGEPIPADVLATCRREALRTDCVLIVGTSAVVFPAAELPQLARSRGARLIEVNLQETPFTPYVDAALRGPAGETLPRLVEKIRALRAQEG